MAKMEIIGLEGIPEVKPGDDLTNLITISCRKQGLQLEDGDILTVTQKIISKAENRLTDMRTVKPSKFASEIAEECGKDSRMVEVILRESKRIVRMAQGIIISKTRHGFVCANAGVDQSNLQPGWLSTLPIDPDKSARELRTGLKKSLNVDVAVVITDTFGRPWREGQVEVALGVSGIKPIFDYRGKRDQHGNLLTVSEIAVADELASAGELVKGKNLRIPIAILRGYRWEADEGSARELVRDPSNDIFL